MNLPDIHDLSMNQDLLEKTERVRRSTEIELNKKLALKFGESPETTIYMISGVVMEDLGFEW